MKLIFDCNFLCYRAHFTTGHLSHHGTRTGIIFGFLNELLELAERFDNRNVLFCWDSKKSYRKKIYPAYKEGREKDEDIDFEQFVKLRSEVLPALGFKNVFVKVGYESDDIMAILVKKNKGSEFCIVACDKDLYQLLSPNVFLYNPIKQEKFRLSEFKKLYGIEPKEWTLAKAIGGCDSDNVKGVQGAADPAKSENSKVIKYLRGKLNEGVIYDRIKESEKLILRNKRLVTLPYRHKGVRPKLKKIKREVLYKKNFIELFDRYGFRYFLKEEIFNRWERTFKLK